MWREVFARITRKRQIEFLEEHEYQYKITIEFKLKPKYDWSEFVCALEVEGETSKLSAVKSYWQELGMQIYGCMKDNGEMCPCLRASSNSSSYKCFRNYLEKNDYEPIGVVPVDLRID